MSHELRTPLNSLLILAKVLSDNPDQNLNDKQLEYSRTIHAAGTDLMKLINEVLDWSKVEAGKMETNPRNIRIAEVLEFVQRGFKPIAEQKGITFVTEVGPDVPVEMQTDQGRLEQILKNLLANAFKFTEDGSIKVEIDVADSSQDFEAESLQAAGTVIAISVSDTGIGIPDEKQQLIFEAFQQADGSTSRKYGGTGLGLSISREIAQALGGEIHVRSQVGRGSTFTLYLPTRHRQAHASMSRGKLEDVQVSDVIEASGDLPDTPLEVNYKQLEGKQALIVDDDPRNLFAIKTLLETYGMKVLTAENGRDGIDTIARHNDIDIVLMDVMMPEMDGYETIKAIRNDPHKQWLPVIAVTAKALKEDRERCINAGASDYLAKPIDENQLLSLISIWARSQQASLL
jgi:two-component system chemotaxis sensor kinase CheA